MKTFLSISFFNTIRFLYRTDFLIFFFTYTNKYFLRFHWLRGRATHVTNRFIQSPNRYCNGARMLIDFWRYGSIAFFSFGWCTHYLSCSHFYFYLYSIYFIIYLFNPKSRTLVNRLRKLHYQFFLARVPVHFQFIETCMGDW